MWINAETAIGFWILVLFSSQFCSVVESVILDSRCYLEGGGSAESFLASEDMEIGSVIGKLRINGNPHIEKGDINLSLRERDSPVKIPPGTKNIVLIAPLDKEGIKGSSSIYVDVICDRRHSTDPSFVIPVNVRVTDVNDNSPQWIGTPYILTLSEVTVTGTRILQGAKAIDNDQTGPFSTVEYQVLQGPNSEFVQFLNPLEGTLVLKKPLDYETMKNFTLRLRAQDHGTPPRYTDTTLKVKITDADDQNPKFLKESYSGELPIDGRPGEIKIRPETIKAVDQDEGICAPIQYSIVQSQDTKFFRINPSTGVITLVTAIGFTELINGATLVVKATQIDNPDRYALTTVTLSRPGTNSELTTLSFVQKKFTIRVREDVSVGSRLLALPTNKPGKPVKYFIPDAIQAQFFSIGVMGEVILQRKLDYEKATKHDFQVLASDGLSNATSDVSVEVIDVNDWEPRFRQSHYEFVIPKASFRRRETLDGVLIGKIEAADGDRNDKLELSLRGQHANIFDIDNVGNIFMRPDQHMNQSIVHLVATATDTGNPPRSASVPVTITMEGVALPQISWASSVWGMFGIISSVFIMIILTLACYIVKTKKSTKSRNRVHNQAHSTVSSANLVTHEKMATTGNGVHHMNGGNITMSNPISSIHTQATSLGIAPSNILPPISDRERQRESYAATVRSIVSRASANGQLYEEEDEMDHDSLSNQENASAIQENGHKKQAWEDAPRPTNLLSSSENMGSTENNLTVYF